MTKVATESDGANQGPSPNCAPPAFLRRGGPWSLRGPASAFVVGIAVCLLAARGSCRPTPRLKRRSLEVW
jgi:hypothetical protein